MRENIITETTEFIRERFLPENLAESLDEETLLLDERIIDSSGILVLIMHIEEKYNIMIDDTELVPEKFNTISALSELVESKLRG